MNALHSHHAHGYTLCAAQIFETGGEGGTSVRSPSTPTLHSAPVKFLAMRNPMDCPPACGFRPEKKEGGGGDGRAHDPGMSPALRALTLSIAKR